MDKKVTIYTLAEELNMSVAAISRAFTPNSKLKKEKKQLILETAAKYGYIPNRMASRLSMNTIRIGVLNYSHIKVYYSEIMRGIHAAYADFKDFKIECDVRDINRADHTMEYALNILDEFLEKHFDGVIISGIYEDDVIEKINLLAEKGIKVATLQYDINKSQRLFASLSDSKLVGEIAAQLCDMLLRERSRKVILFTGNKTSPTHQTVVSSFKNSALKFNLEIIDIYDTKDVPQYAEDLVKQAFKEHTDIGAIYSSTANSIPICRYLFENGLQGKVVFIASDIFDELSRYIEYGVVDATIYQDPFQMGYSAFENLFNHIANGEKIPSVITSKPQIVIASNLCLYK